MKTTMKYGAQKGKMNFWRRWMAKVASRELCIFPVPGADLLRTYQSEPLSGEARLTAQPREANVLLVVGDMSRGMAEQAATVYAQMPRPRVLVMAGQEHLDPLPHPDVHVALEKDFLQTALPAVRECLSSHAWTDEPEPWQPEALVKKIEEAGQQQGHMHDHGGHDHGGHGPHDHGHEGHRHGGHEGHEHHHEEHNHSGHQHGLHSHGPEDHSHSHEQESGDKKGHHGEADEHKPDHEAHQHGSHGEHEGHQHHDHGEHDHGHEGHQHKGHNHGEGPQEHDHSQHEEHGHSHEGHDHGGHGHGGHDHGSGFMSMIAMTKDLPRSAYGLPMEWSDVQFGPFHPGLPGGLRLSMKLDGDTVAEAEADRDLPGRNLLTSAPENPAALPEYLEAVNPMAPVTYRLLAQKTLASFSGEAGGSALTFNEAVLLEKERITSHLNWLAVLAVALGSNWMRDQAINHYHRFQNGTGNTSQLSGFIRRIKQMPYLKLKLSAGGYRQVRDEGHDQRHSERSPGSDDHLHSGHQDHGHQYGEQGHGHGEDHQHGGHKEDHQHDHGHGHEDHNHGDHQHGAHGYNHEMHQHAGHEQERGDEKEHDTGTVPGRWPDDITGPVARAAGMEKDQRMEEAVYRQAGWTPVTAAGNNAWSRLLVRLDEMVQSLQFIEKAGKDSGRGPSQKINLPSAGMGNGIACIESPRGTVTLKFHIHEGKLAHMHLTTPSAALTGIIQQVTEQRELADALTAVTSLDISPWEINP